MISSSMGEQNIVILLTMSLFVVSKIFSVKLLRWLLSNDLAQMFIYLYSNTCYSKCSVNQQNFNCWYDCYHSTHSQNFFVFNCQVYKLFILILNTYVIVILVMRIFWSNVRDYFLLLQCCFICYLMSSLILHFIWLNLNISEQI